MTPRATDPNTGQQFATSAEFAAAARDIADGTPDVCPTTPMQSEDSGPSGLEELQTKLADLTQRAAEKQRKDSLRFDPNRPPSEAAAEQGHRRPFPDPPKRRRTRKTPRPNPGPLRGDSESDVRPAGHEPYEPLSPEARQAGQLALGGVRRLKQDSSDL